MNSSNSGIKIHCDEFLNSNLSDEQALKILTKFSSILKISEKFQKDFFIHLSDKGLNKLLHTLKDNNLEIRKASCRVLLELLNNNEVLQNIFCEKFNFNPIGNVICLNWLPKDLKENLKIDSIVIMDIKNSISAKEKVMKYWMWPPNEKYSDEVIPDPQKYLIGFYYANKNSFFNNNSEALRNEDRLDINGLISKLESENLEEEKIIFVAAGSGSESSSMIKERRASKENHRINESINQTTISRVDKDQILVSSEKDSGKSVGGTSSNQIDKKKLKEDYRRNIKDKSYSRSIDTNIQKFNYINAVATSALASTNTNTGNINSNQNPPAQQYNQDTLANKLKTGKKK